MFTVLADAIFTATLTRQGSHIPEQFKDHADRHVARTATKEAEARAMLSPYKHLW